MHWNFFSYISSQILEPFSFLSSVSEGLISIIMPIILIALTIKVMWFGYETLRGQGGSNALMEAVFRNIRPMLVIGIGLTGGAYATNVVGLVEEIRTTLTSALTHTQPANSYAALDMSIDRVMQTFYAITDDAWENNISIGVMQNDLTGIPMIVTAAIMALALLLYAIVAVAQLLIIDVILQIVLAIGPIFIALFAFSSTSRFFDSWLSTILKYTLTASLIMLVISVANAILDNYASSLQSSASLMGYYNIAFYSIVAAALLVYFTLKIPSLAGDILGSVGVSLFSPAAVAAPVATAAASVASPVAAAAGNYLGSKANSTANMMRNLVNRATRSSGTGSISPGNASSAFSQADWAKGLANRNAAPLMPSGRPATSSMQSKILNGE